MTPIQRSQAGSNFRRLLSNLRRDRRAMSLLAAIGVDENLVEEVGLGLKEPYTRSDGTRVENVLAFPLAAEGARRRYAYLNLPEHTLNPEHALGWGPGRPHAVSAGVGADLLIVCASALQVWQVHRAALAASVDLTAACSSQPGKMPSAWLEQRYWTGWGRIVVLAAVEPACRRAIARASARPIEKAEQLPWGERWDGDGAMARGLLEMLACAEPFRMDVADLLSGPAAEEGDFAAAPISIHGGIKEGRSFYAFMVERRAVGSGRADRVLHQYQPLVLRSDGALLEAVTLPSPRGTPTHRRVHALSDGTRINACPDPGHHSSWSLAGIRRYVSARQRGHDPCEIEPADVASEVVAHLRSAVPLPREADYWVLGAFVVATYVYRLFDAMPIIHICGEKGSGKSELTAALVSLGFNGQTMSQGSASALVRLVKESGGLVALDDAEALSGAGGEIGQALKVGYKRSTAIKVVALPGGRTEAIDFFGPRVVCNTLGLDPILATRSILVRTDRGVHAAADAAPPMTDVTDLRDAMHALGMARLEQFADAYAEVRRAVRDRQAEIWAPLRAVAHVVGSSEMRMAITEVADASGEGGRASS